MAIGVVVAKDVVTLNNIAYKAIIDSVAASDEIKQHVIADTARHIDENISRTDCVFLKFSNATGTIGFILIQEYWNLSDLFVLPDWHGKDVGASLFNTAKSICLANQQKDFIRVNSSLNAEGFYRKQGFVDFTQGKEQPSFIVPLIYRL